jgi:uncharacterized phiE125 gp8 family phage protein
MSLQLITPPAVEPVTLDEAKAHLKVDTTDDDALIARSIAAARARAEWHTGRAFVTQSWILWLDEWPLRGAVGIPLPPLIQVASVTTYGRDDAASAVDPANYQVDAVSQPGRLVLKDTVVPPIANLRSVNAIAIAFDAGYGAAAGDVPAPLREAVLEIVAELYVHRGDGPEEIALSAQALLAPYRIFNL